MEKTTFKVNGRKKIFKLPKDFLKHRRHKILNFKFDIPTIKCTLCGDTIIATPTNILNNKIWKDKLNWSSYCATTKNRNQCSEKNCILFPMCVIKKICNKS